MTCKSICYEAKCVVNGKLYFGITSKTLSYRIGRHLSAANNGCSFRLHKAIRKYGSEKFSWRVVGEGCWGEMCDLERSLISSFETRSPQVGYNDTDGGEGVPGRIVSIEARKKMADSHRGKTLSEKHKQSLRDAWKSRPPVSDLTKRKLSDVRLGKPMHFSAEALRKISNANKGKKRTAETRSKISRSLRARCSAVSQESD